MQTVRILGTHGVPAAYGGFETAAENIGRHLVRSGWRVVVYCQAEGRGSITTDEWEGMERVHIPVDLPGWRGTSKFDLLSTRHAARFDDVCLVFGYNTAVFNIWQRLKRIPLVINMDGIEWSRKRWGPARQAILYVNERIASLLGQVLIADHPEIEKYLRGRADPRKIVMVTYGADAVTQAPTEPVTSRGLTPGRYATLICRSIPENSVLELVEGFSARTRGHQLVVLGNYDPAVDPYHRDVMAAASEEVVFLGSIYDPAELTALRFHSRLYLHGHTVGGTNPSLVEAMAAGNAVLAHDNVYNRWVAGDSATYFTDAADAASELDRLLSDDSLLAMGEAARRRHAEEFTWEHIAARYEAVLARQAAAHATSRGTRS